LVDSTSFIVMNHNAAANENKEQHQ